MARQKHHQWVVRGTHEGEVEQRIELHLRASLLTINELKYVQSQSVSAK